MIFIETAKPSVNTTSTPFVGHLVGKVIRGLSKSKLKVYFLTFTNLLIMLNLA